MMSSSLGMRSEELQQQLLLLAAADSTLYIVTTYQRYWLRHVATAAAFAFSHLLTLG
jgi:hypothetical protein